MSSVIRDTATSLKCTGQLLNDFLYEDGKPIIKKGAPGTLKEHTKEELENMLEHINDNIWNSYYDIAREMGWI